MRPDILFTTQQITLIILALLDDQPTYDQYREEKPTNWLVIDSLQSTTGSVLTSVQIRFFYTPPTQRDTLTPPNQYQLTIGCHQTGGSFKAVLVTLAVLVDRQWVHCPLRHLPFVLDKLQEYASR
jgi:hypothetical protein